MKLKAVYDSKDEVPEQHSDLYTEQDGKFVLSEVEGIKTQQDVDNVQSALKRERQLKRDLQKQLEAFDGIEADGLREQLDELEKLRTTNGKVDNKEIDSIVEQRLKLDKAKYERELQNAQKRAQELAEQNETLVNEKNRTLIENSLREAAKGKVNESALNDVLFRASLFEVSEDGQVLTRENNGVTPGQDPQSWLDETLKDNIHWQTKSSGVGARGSGGNPSVKPDSKPSSIKEIVAESVSFN